MENMISVPLHEYEELVRDSEKLRIITEKAVRAAKKRLEMGAETILEVAGYKTPEEKPIALAQRIRPDKTDSMSSVSIAISDALKEAYIDGAFPENMAVELKKQIREKNR